MIQKDTFKGDEFWRKMNFGIIFLVYAFLFIMMIFPQFSKTMLTGLGFFIIGYIAFQQYYFREMDKKNRGKIVIAGWATHNYGVGEEFELPKVKLEPITKLSPTDLASVDLFINTLVVNEKEKRKEIKADMGNLYSEKKEIEYKGPIQDQENNEIEGDYLYE